MAKRLKMTKRELDAYFRSEYMPHIRELERQYRRTKDIPLRCQEWG